ncbi:MAG: EAL domain-containing protein [Xanthomonadales bacterium]|nr:EAL domain-containing protein [Xanthomonadales bacterium]
MKSVEGAGVGAGHTLRQIPAQPTQDSQIVLKSQMVDESSDVMAVLSPDGVFVEANQAYCEMVGLPRSDIVGQHVKEIVTDVFYKQNVAPNLARCLKSGHSSYVARRAVTHGRTVVLDVRYKRLEHGPGNETVVVVVARDITESQRMQDELWHQARHCPMTGLMNRTEFEAAVGVALRHACDGRHHYTLCLLDLDYFKIINDACGHQAGDEVLRDVARLIDTATRRSDIASRIGGDEFGILLPDCTANQAVRLVETVRRAIKDYEYVFHGRTFRLGCSIGVVALDESMGSINVAMNAADIACRSAKANGRARVEVYRDNVDANHPISRNSIVSFISGLKDDSLRLYWQELQPINREESGGRTFEFLVRGVTRDERIIPAGEFIHAAERYGLIDRIDRWVIANALDTICRSDDIRLGLVNMSAKSLADPDFGDFILSCADRTGVDPQRVGLEITESAAIDNFELAIELIERLRNEGFQFALDDFGSGMSSLAHLARIPVSMIKIDGSLIRNVTQNPIQQEIVRSVARIADAGGLASVAEHVENDEILAWLQSSSIDYAQGFGIHVPEAVPR